jgi:hypothetical protein
MSIPRVPSAASAARVPERVPRRAVHRPGGCSVNSSARVPPSAVAGWPRLPRPGSHGKPERDAKLQSPVSRPTGAVLGSSRIGRDCGGDGRIRCALKISARKLGPDGRVACGTGWESNVCGAVAMCTETWCPSRVAALGTAAWSAWLESRAGWPALARGVHPTAVVTVQEAHACSRVSDASPTPALSVHLRVTACSLCIPAAVGLCRKATSDGVPRGCAPRWRWRTRAPAGANEPAPKTIASGRFGRRGTRRTSTGATCSITVSKRGSSGGQSSSL